MAAVGLSEQAKKDIDGLPVTVRARVAGVLARLSDWPAVSGAKPLRGELKGHFRIRTGDWRVIFTASGDAVTVTRVAHRSTIYED